MERHHRTIKVMAERGQVIPMEAVFWYNVSPRSARTKKVSHMELYFATSGDILGRSRCTLRKEKALSLSESEKRFG